MLKKDTSAVIKDISAVNHMDMLKYEKEKWYLVPFAAKVRTMPLKADTLTAAVETKD